MFAHWIRGFAPLSLALALALAGCETASRSASVPQVTVIEDDNQGTSAVNIASLTEVIQRNPSDPSAYNEREIQLVLGTDQYARNRRYEPYRQLLGAKVIATGTLLPGGARYNKRLVLAADDIRKARRQT